MHQRATRSGKGKGSGGGGEEVTRGNAYLHEEAGDERAPDVEVVVAAREVGAGAPQVEAVHDAAELLAHVVGALQRPEVDEVVVAPLLVLAVCQRRTQRQPTSTDVNRRQPTSTGVNRRQHSAHRASARPT